MAFIFTVAAEKFLKNNLNMKTTNFGVVPVEAAPSQTAADYGSLTNISTASGGGSLVKSLLDVGGDNNNRITQNAVDTQVDIKFEPVLWASLDTATGAPIVGFVVVDSTSPSSGSTPVFYVDRVNVTTGVPESFTPDGSTSLAPDFATWPLSISDYGSQFFDDYRYKLIRGDENFSWTNFSIVLLEAVPTQTWTQFSELTNVAVGPASENIYKVLADIGGSSSNRVYTSGTNAYVRFDDLVWPALDTLSGNPITHYCIVEGTGTLGGTAQLVSWGEVQVGGVPGFTPDGIKNMQLTLSSGVVKI